MSKEKNTLFFKKRQLKRNQVNQGLHDISDEIIDDSALIDCMNQLNSLKECENNENYFAQKDVLNNIERISVEMNWFSQWLTAKSDSAA